MLIRPMQLNDLEQVTAIDRQSFNLPWPNHAYHYELTTNANALLWVAEYTLPHGGQRVVGMIVVWLIVDEVHIATIAVDPAYRRLGIGERLLEVALQEGMRRGARQALLEVRAGNQAAQALYRKFGFETVGRRPRFYQDNFEDAVLMTADLETTLEVKNEV
jgi:ribosomal-protein-alanine N-acetyltransferase